MPYDRAAAQIAQVDRPIIFLYVTVAFAGVSSNVSGVQMTPLGFVSLANAQLKQ